MKLRNWKSKILLILPVLVILTYFFITSTRMHQSAQQIVDTLKPLEAECIEIMTYADEDEPYEPNNTQSDRTAVNTSVAESITCKCNAIANDSVAASVRTELLTTYDPVSHATSLSSLAAHHPNLPVRIINGSNAHCDKRPNIFSIDWIGVHWQRFQTKDGHVMLIYSAFYDDRPNTRPLGGIIRLLVLFRGATNPNISGLPWCSLWYDDQEEPVISRVIRADYIDYQKRYYNRYQPYLLTCRARNNTQSNGTSVNVAPLAVSLTNHPCVAAHNLAQIIGQPSSELPHLQLKTSDFLNTSSPIWRVGICGPALYYLQEDFSLRLVEWLELVKELGVSQVFLYQTSGVHPNIEKVLRYYEDQGFVSITDFHYPPPYMDEPLLRRIWTETQRKQLFAMENIYFTDCILRNKDKYRFLAHVDPDELPVLLQHKSLSALVAELLRSIKRKKRLPAGYKIMWQLFPNYASDADKLIPGYFNNSILYNTSHPLSNDTNYNVPFTSDAHLPELPSYFHILRHYRKTNKITERVHINGKSIYDTQDTTAVMSHHVILCASDSCRPLHKVSLGVAYIGHFKTKCPVNCEKETTVIQQILELRTSAASKIIQVVRLLNLLD